MAFFDDLGAKLTRAGQITRQKANDLGDTARITKRTNDLNRANQELYTKLGEAYYNLHSQMPEPALQELCNALTRNYSEMESLRQELQRIRQIRVCPVCGAENPPDARFCCSCSSALPELAPPPAPAPAMGRVCPACGSLVGDTAMFCTSCGTRLEAPAAPAAPAAAPDLGDFPPMA